EEASDGGIVPFPLQLILYPDRPNAARRKVLRAAWFGQSQSIHPKARMREEIKIRLTTAVTEITEEITEKNAWKRKCVSSLSVFLCVLCVLCGSCSVVRLWL